MFHTPNLTTKGKEKQLVNAFVSCHDLSCNCNEPAFHSLLVLTKTLAPELSEKNKQQLIACLGSTTTAATATEEEDLGIEDLEKLFAEDGTEEETG